MATSCAALCDRWLLTDRCMSSGPSVRPPEPAGPPASQPANQRAASQLSALSRSVAPATAISAPPYTLAGSDEILVAFKGEALQRFRCLRISQAQTSYSFPIDTLKLSCFSCRRPLGRFSVSPLLLLALDVLLCRGGRRGEEGRRGGVASFGEAAAWKLIW